MTRRLLLASGSGTVSSPPPPPDPAPEIPDEPTLPYAFPAAAPWNAPEYAITPTPDGTGSAVHPSTLDFGGNPWNGHRFWMAYTPYFGSVVELENPSVAYSDDGYEWTVPAGLTNPIAPDPAGSSVYNSDTELVHDPASNTLVCYWREIDETTGITNIRRLVSANGTTWASPGVALNTTGGNLDALSPAVVRNDNGSANMWVISGVTLKRYSAASLTGTFSAPTNCTITALPEGNVWHVGITRSGSTHYGLIATTSPWNLVTIKSTDGGVTWQCSGQPVMEPDTEGWDSFWLYRGSLQLHQDGEHMRVWYSAASSDGPTSWRIGYTRIPLTEWPT